LDTGAKNLEMGARRFGPDVGRFLQADLLEGALGDLGLAADPLTGNRYALAGGLLHLATGNLRVARAGQAGAEAVPRKIFREGTPSPSNLRPRPGEEALSPSAARCPTLGTTG
jgi:hypothetical protein